MDRGVKLTERVDKTVQVDRGVRLTGRMDKSSPSAYVCEVDMKDRLECPNG